MTERPKWWKALLPKKKTTGPAKDGGSAHTMGPDFDPFGSEKQRDPSCTAAPKTTSDQAPHQQGHKTDLGDDTFDDSHLESLFNEQTCRRKFNISRSGRFKDKNRIRSTIPTTE